MTGSDAGHYAGVWGTGYGTTVAYQDVVTGVRGRGAESGSGHPTMRRAASGHSW
jgi:hypothetical protein